MITRLNIELEKMGKTKKLIPLRKDAICEPMKQMTLEKVERCLIEEKYEITLDKEVIEKAKKAIEYMLNI
jgi:quinolinate synthase